MFLLPLASTFMNGPSNHSFMKRALKMTSSVVFEVEQKFALAVPESSHQVEAKLVELGMENKATQVFVDWYFDLPNWILTTSNCWLRHREARGWQLKRGTQQADDNNQDGATVYQELEGDDAIQATLAMLPLYTKEEGTGTIPTEYQQFDIPQLPQPNNLVPFARIRTTRSTWTAPANCKDSKLVDLIVDLDATDYGYMVGEVEMVVYNKADVAAARARVKAFAAQLVPDSNNDKAVAPLGKLEFYMIQNRPDHYNACITTGSMQKAQQQ